MFGNLLIDECSLFVPYTEFDGLSDSIERYRGMYSSKNGEYSQ